MICDKQKHYSYFRTERRLIMPELIKGIPNMHLFLFGGGLIAAAATLIVLKIRDRGKHKKRDKFSDYDE